jgi:hypothetical protein
MSDMATCPLPELVTHLREHADKAFDSKDMLRGMVFNALAHRFESCHERIDVLERTLERLGNDVETEVEVTLELSDGGN